ncbi:MAG: 30S ribosomal protein S5 [Candidatus Brocadiaceae bacterium]|nr:30S ribosomal protein S5 [Candidatus Brocadiaceae bacterium]
MAEEAVRGRAAIEDTVVAINRCTAVTKGGKSLSFSALVVAGDGQGQVGLGFGKAREVPSAVTKASKDARKSMANVFLKGDTIPHEVWGRYRASRVYMRPAAPGTGIKAGAAARAVLELAGVRNILTKCYGSRNPMNVVKATLEGLKGLRSIEEVNSLKGAQKG